MIELNPHILCALAEDQVAGMADRNKVSIYRAALSSGYYGNFAVVWDEDHDARVVETAYQFILAGLFDSVIGLVEHEGVLQILAMSQQFDKYGTRGDVELDAARYERLILSHGDYWTIYVQSTKEEALRVPGYPWGPVFDLMPAWKLDQQYKLVNPDPVGQFSGFDAKKEPALFMPKKDYEDFCLT